MCPSLCPTRDPINLLRSYTSIVNRNFSPKTPGRHGRNLVLAPALGEALHEVPRRIAFSHKIWFDCALL